MTDLLHAIDADMHIIERQQVLDDAEALLGEMDDSDRDEFMADLWERYKNTQRFREDAGENERMTR